MPRPADRRAKIELLRAAEAVFVEHGLAASKVEDITARAGVSKGAFYLHFEGKEDCFRQIVEGFVAKLAACLEEAPPPTDASGAASFARNIDRWRAHDVSIFEFCWQNRGLLRMIFSGGGGSSYGYLIDEFAERVADQIKDWARHLMEVGVYRRDLDPEVLPALMSGGYERLMREMIKRPRRPDLAEWSRQAMGLYLRGLLTDEARAVLDSEVTSPQEVAAPSSGDRGVGSGDPPRPQTPSSEESAPRLAGGRARER